MQDEKGTTPPKSTLISRNVTVRGRRTSVRLEPEMWMSLKEISKRERCTIHDLCSLINVRKNENTSLTAAIRVFLMLYFRASSTEEGHKRVGHGNFEYMKRRARVYEDLNKPVISKKVLAPDGNNCKNLNDHAVLADMDRNKRSSGTERRI